MSPHLYRLLMREKAARLRQPAGAPISHTRGNHGASARAQPDPCRTTALRAVERKPVVTTPSAYRQLNQRTADGLAVALEWNPATYGLRIVVMDHASETVTFPVRAADASDAFVHPFIYADARSARSRDAAPETP
jgi:hypothetical protein